MSAGTASLALVLRPRLPVRYQPLLTCHTESLHSHSPHSSPAIDRVHFDLLHFLLFNLTTQPYHGRQTNIPCNIRADSRGDAPTFRVIATADALSSAQTILRSLSSGRQMSWRLIRTNAPPKLMSVRVASIDHEGNAEAGQVVVRFDTDQVSLVFQLPIPCTQYP